MAAPRRPIAPAPGHRATLVELLFDLVFVFALIQMTVFLHRGHAWRGLAEGLILLTLLWWVWSAYAWLGNQAHADTLPMRIGFALAMAALFVTALAIQESWHDAPGGLYTPAVFVCGFLAVRACYFGLAFYVAAGDPAMHHHLRRALARASATGLALVVGALFGGVVQLVLWGLAAAADWVVPRVTPPTGGWRLHSPSHFAERHGLIVIIALGELLISFGDGVSANQSGAHIALNLPILLSALTCIALTVGLWWLYFSFVSPPLEHRLGLLHGTDRVPLARHAYDLLHFPLVAGVVYVAFGLEQLVGVLQGGQSGIRDLSSPLPWPALVALYGGVAAYLAAGPAIQHISAARPSVPQLTAAVASLAAVPLAHALPALLAVASLAALLLAVVAVESARAPAHRPAPA
ncbi:low temperature requirement protein A [Streptomyces sp. NPDC020742]|uniref:low temperature requirement protein A n=1 Tax=Streptomyces sp. NPDC020742 TaxID=3154897 RepID=UPI0033DF95C6